MNTTKIEAMRQLLKDFYNLTGIKVCIYDSAGNELCYYPSKLSGFCELLRLDVEMNERCRECDRRGFAECRRTRTQQVYTCHAGLQECISPIIHAGKLIGFIMVGQIKKREGESFENIKRAVHTEQTDALRAAHDSLPTISKEKLASVFHILDACAGYELLGELMNIGGAAIDSKLDRYVNDNLSAPLSVSELCREFHLSRYEIYEICKEYFASTPAEFIKSRRLAYACKLLSTTDYAVQSIAQACGIPDYNYFSKVFKSTFGISPTEYRKNHSRPAESN